MNIVTFVVSATWPEQIPKMWHESRVELSYAQRKNTKQFHMSKTELNAAWEIGFLIRITTKPFTKDSRIA